jgi:hypothetical protein
VDEILVGAGEAREGGVEEGVEVRCDGGRGRQGGGWAKGRQGCGGGSQAFGSDFKIGVAHRCDKEGGQRVDGAAIFRTGQIASKNRCGPHPAMT